MGSGCWIKRGLAACCALAVSGCASFTYVDANHNRHVIGFVDMTLPEAASPAAQTVTLTTVGVSVQRLHGSDSAIALGYSKTTLTALSDNACLNLDTGKACTLETASADLKGTTP